MTERGIPVPSAFVAVAIVAATIVAGAGVASAHGGFAVTTLGTTDGAVDVPVSYGVAVTTGEPDAGDAEEIDVDVTVTADGDVVERRSFTAAPTSTEQFTVTHAFESAGERTLNVTATFSSGDWSDSETSSATVDVAPSGSEAALGLCKDAASESFSSPSRIGCHLEHDDGPLGGLLGGVVASWPLVALSLAVAIAAVGTVVVRRQKKGE